MRKAVGIRFVVTPKGGSNVYLTIFDYFFGGSVITWELRGTRGGLNPPTPEKSSTESSATEETICRAKQIICRGFGCGAFVQEILSEGILGK